MPLRIPCLPRHLARPLCMLSSVHYFPYPLARLCALPAAPRWAPRPLLRWTGWVAHARAPSCGKPLPLSGPPCCLSTLSRARRPWRLSSARTGLRAGREDRCRPMVPIGPERARASWYCPQSWQPELWSAAAERAQAAASVPRRRGQGTRSCSALPAALAPGLYRWVSAVRCPVGWAREGDGRGRGTGARKRGAPRAACPRGRARGAAGPGAGPGRRIRSSRRPPSPSAPVWVGAVREGRRPDAPARSGHSGLVGIPGAFAALTSQRSRGAPVLGHGRRRPRRSLQDAGRAGASLPSSPPPRSPVPPPPPRSGGEGVGRETRSLGQVPTPRQKT